MRGHCSFRVMLASLAFIFTAASSPGEIIFHHALMADADGDIAHCLSCHDGTQAKNVHVCLEDCGFQSPHPVTKRYPPRGKEDLFPPAALLSAKGIKLPGDRLSCISCHDIRKNGKYHLVIEKTGSKLCMTCHITK